MGVNHGQVLGATKILDNGPDLSHYTIALMSEGYTQAQMPAWEADARDLMDHLLEQAPFDELELRCALNIYRIDVVSDESGADDPRCGDTGPGEKVKTYFDATFCAAADVRRTMALDTQTALLVLLSQVPFWRMGLVVVNSTVRGGTGGSIPIVSNGGTDWLDTCVHELGHSAFGLADEYPTYAGCDTEEEGHDVALPFEPSEPNVTVLQQLLPSGFKWGGLVDPATPLPTMQNPDPDCTACDPRTEPVDPAGNPVPNGTVGAFEGARYFHCGIYRPEFDCRMRTSSKPFCAVCAQVVRDTLAPFEHPPSADLLSPSVAFPDIEAGTTVTAAVSLAVDWCDDLTFWVTDWPHRVDGGPEVFHDAPVLDLPLGRNPTSPGSGPRTAYVWVSYQATDPGDTLLGTISVECNETHEVFTVLITGNTVAPHTVGVMLSLDASGSMTEPASGGDSKEEALRYAAEVFVNVMPDADGVGVNTFASDATEGVPIAVAGGVLGGGRSNAREFVLREYAPDPQGLTSIGDALALSDEALGTPGVGFDEWAVVVFTDGMETEPQYISDVAGSLSSSSRIFAVGLGTPENLDPATLATLCSGSGGALLLSGADSGDTYFLLAKYFLKILAGLTNTEVVRDPEGYLPPGVTVRIPFMLSETDTSADVILLTPVPSAVDFTVEGPTGQVLRPASSAPGVTFARGTREAHYRISLPALIDGQPAREGTWHALLRIDLDAWTAGDNAPLLYRYLQQHPEAVANGLPYAVQVQARSNLRLAASCHQDSYEPGAELRVRAVLTEYGLPVDGRATVTADLTRPDGTAAHLAMPEVEPGVFEVLETAHQAGVHHFRVLAGGTTLRGYPFTREDLLTGFAYHGGDDPSRPGSAGDGGGLEQWCRLFRCVLGAVTPQTYDRLGIDPARLRHCVDQVCGSPGMTTSHSPVDLDPADIDLIRDAARQLGMSPPRSSRGDPRRS
ncbi:MAG TPA: M64 family metallopeptidase [Dermatophilaceae bacterium]|nr:M64 family metallopeptidase [Dermatophilaceae bacterium]